MITFAERLRRMRRRVDPWRGRIDLGYVIDKSRPRATVWIGGPPYGPDYGHGPTSRD